MARVGGVLPIGFCMRAEYCQICGNQLQTTSGVIEGNSENWSGYVITDASNHQ